MKDLHIDQGADTLLGQNYNGRDILLEVGELRENAARVERTGIILDAGEQRRLEKWLRKARKARDIEGEK